MRLVGKEIQNIDRAITMHFDFFKNFNLSFLTLKYACMYSFSLLFFLNINPSIAASNDSKVNIIGFSLEYRLTDRGKSQYNRFFSEIKNEGLDFDLKIAPFKRAIREFSDKDDGSCIFPTSLNAIVKAAPSFNIESVVASNPVDKISLRVFSNSRNPIIQSIEELNGKTVALWNGLQPELFLSGVNAKVETTSDELVRVKMLNANRIDAILGFTPDVILAAQRLGLPEPHFDNRLALFQDEGASLVCKISTKNKNFVKQFNELVSKLKSNGKLLEILGPHVDIAP